MEQLEDNLQCINVALSADELARLSATTAPPKMYPQWMYEMQNQGR
jgi:aryl-alcohol dehydrogenase-like predicted oxidoreductase